MFRECAGVTRTRSVLVCIPTRSVGTRHRRHGRNRNQTRIFRPVRLRSTDRLKNSFVPALALDGRTPTAQVGRFQALGEFLLKPGTRRKAPNRNPIIGNARPRHAFASFHRENAIATSSAMAKHAGNQASESTNTAFLRASPASSGCLELVEGLRKESNRE